MRQINMYQNSKRGLFYIGVASAMVLFNLVSNLVPSAVAAEGYVIEEVVVTARKREEALQSVSIAVTTFSDTDIKTLGLSQPADLGAQTPNLHVKNAVGYSNPIFTIRGVGLNTFLGNSSPGVGVYVDEVFLVSNSLMGFQLFDMERVEVLKGPQGTLFGRNTTGGAVSFVTKTPEQEFEADISVGIADKESLKLEGAVGGGITDTLAARFAASIDQQNEGYFTDRVSGSDHGEVDRASWRLALAWELSDISRIDLNIHGGTDKSENWMWDSFGINDPALAVVNPNVPNGVGSFVGGTLYNSRCAARTDDNFSAIGSCVNRNGYSDGDVDPFKGDYSLLPEIDNDTLGFVFRVDVDFDFATLTAITGYEDFEKSVQEDFDGSPYRIADNTYTSDIKLFSQELRLTSNSKSTVDWIVGLFFGSDENDTFDRYGATGRFLTDLLVDFEQETDSTAIFGHLKWQISNQWRLIAGARFTDEEISFDGGTFNEDTLGVGTNIFGVNFGASGPLVLRDETISAEEVTGKIGIDFTPTDNWLVYSSISRGFKSGGYNGTWNVFPGDDAPYEPETVDAFELGFKSTLADSAVQFNANFFYYNYTDLQFFAFLPSGAFALTNASDASISGIEADIWARPALGWNIKLGMGYTDSELEDYTDASGLDLSGNELGNTPELNFNGLIAYERALSGSSGLTVAGSIDFSWQDDIFFTADNRKDESQDSYSLVNARFSVASEDVWRVSLWAKNLTDEEYISEAFTSGTSATLSHMPGRPRTYGIDFDYRWE